VLSLFISCQAIEEIAYGNCAGHASFLNCWMAKTASFSSYEFRENKNNTQIHFQERYSATATKRIIETP
jgi:hypothetical protein